MRKSQLREEFRAIREGLASEYVADASAALCQRLGHMVVVQEAEKIIAYLRLETSLI